MMAKILIIALLLLSAFAVSAETQNSGGGYVLAAGDVIKISVFGEPEISIESIMLSDAGTFSFPFIGTVNARNLTTTQLEAALIDALKGDYLIEPRISVSIVEYRKFFINGEVRKPGGYSYHPGMTLREATAMAGGLTERASLRRMTIIRIGVQNPIQASLDIKVNPGDIITIDQGFF